MRINPKTTHFLQIGLGSMGRRRIRALLHNRVPAESIFGFDISLAHCRAVGAEYGIQTFSRFKEALAQAQPQVFIISTPPDYHKQYLLFAAKNKIHFFEDTSALDAGYRDLSKLLDGTFVAAFGCAFRFLSAIKKMKKLVSSGSIGTLLAFNHHVGQYLPDWHPWEDYRRSYLAQANTGACQQAFNFELSWLTDLLGASVKTVQAMTGKVSNLEVRADNVLLSNITLKNGIIGSMMVECVSRQPYRTLQLMGTKGNIDWDHQKNELVIYQTKGKNPKPGTPMKKKTILLKKGSVAKGYAINVEEPYREEMRMFIEAIAGRKKFPYTFDASYASLRTLFALKQSSRTKRAVTVMSK